MILRLFLPVFTLVAFFPFFAQSQCALSVNAGSDTAMCQGDNRTLTATATGGVAPYTFTWTHNSATTSTASVSSAGSFSVEVIDANGCKASDTVLVTVRQCNTLIVNVGADATTCKNVTKTFTPSVSNGLAPYTYAWSTGATTPSVSPTISGNFAVTVTDATGLTGSDTVALTVLDTADFTLEIRPDTALFLSCNNKNVIVKALPNGVLPVSDFKWSTGEISLQFITVYQTGTYGVVVTALNGCESRKSISVIENKTPPNVSILPVPNPAILNCNTPRVLLDAISTTPSVVFKWSTNATTSSIYATNVGIHTVTASNPEFGGGNGCSATAQIDVKSNNPSVSLGANMEIQSGQNATLTAAVSSGVAPFNYAWSTGATTPSVSVSTSGNFSVTITDGNGCKASDIVVVTVTGGCNVSFNVNQNNNYCYGSNVGSIYISPINGGRAPFQYSFNDGLNFSPNPYLLQVTAGTYVVVVKDANNCTATKTVVLTEGSKINFTTAATPTCNNTGTIRISNVSGGNGQNYQYFITNLPFRHRFYNTWTPNPVFNDLPPNTYFVKVRDESGCATQPPVAVVVGANAGFSATIEGNSTVCFGSTTPLNAPITGGNAPFAYQWIKADASTATTATIQAGVGNFFVTITDANGCTASAMKTVTGVNGVVASISGNTTICGSTTTTLAATGLAGRPPYTFAWNTGKTGTTMNNSTSIDVNVGAGNYCVTVTDANGCSSVVCKTVTTSNLAVSISSIININSCLAIPSTLTARASFGNAPYLYLWNSGNTSNVISVISGTYSVTVTDASGCSVSKSITIAPPSVLTLTLDSVQNIRCNGDANGRIFTTASGGTGQKTFTRTHFTTSQTGSNFLNLAPNTYIIQAKDANGCLSNTVTATITEPRAVTFSTTQTDVLCRDGLDGAISVTATGGVNSLIYSRDNGNTWQSTPLLTGLATGNYRIRVRDANNCTTASQTVNIAQPSVLTFGTATSSVTCNSGTDGEIVIRNPDGGNGLAYQFSKDNGASWQNSGGYSNVVAGIYSVRIRDVKGCASAARQLTVSEPAPITFATVVSDITCGFNSNGVIGLTNLNGAPQYRYSRNGGATFQVHPNFTNLVVGTYPIVIRDNKGCLSAVKNTAVRNACTVVAPLIQLEPTQRIPIVIAALSPNPTIFEVILQVKSLNKRVQKFDFIDVSGKTIASEKRELEGGLNRVSFDVSNLPQGTYFIQTLGSGEGKGQPRTFVKM